MAQLFRTAGAWCSERGRLPFAMQAIPCRLAVWWSERQLNIPLGRHAKLLVFLTALLGSTLIAVSEEQPASKWTAPAAEARKKNPVAVNESSLALGQKIYLQRCAGCHGKTGNGDGPDAADLGIHPAKLSDPAMQQKQTARSFGKSPSARNRCRIIAVGFRPPTAGT